MYEDIYPERKLKVEEVDGLENDIEVDIDSDGNVKIKKKKINLFPNKPKRQKISKKAQETMKRAMRIRKYINKGEKDKE